MTSDSPLWCGLKPTPHFISEIKLELECEFGDLLNLDPAVAKDKIFALAHILVRKESLMPFMVTVVTSMHRHNTQHVGTNCTDSLPWAVLVRTTLNLLADRFWDLEDLLNLPHHMYIKETILRPSVEKWVTNSMKPINNEPLL